MGGEHELPGELSEIEEIFPTVVLAWQVHLHTTPACSYLSGHFLFLVKPPQLPSQVYIARVPL